MFLHLIGSGNKVWSRTRARLDFSGHGPIFYIDQLGTFVQRIPSMFPQNSSTSWGTSVETRDSVMDISYTDCTSVIKVQSDK